jgi:ferritin-like metal-binding protein YciE
MERTGIRMKLESLNVVFRKELAGLYNAEKQLVISLRKMVVAAHHEELRDAFREQLKIAEMHVERLDRIFSRIANEPPKNSTCEAIRGLIEEIDTGLLGAAQHAEHREIACYGCAVAYAELLGDKESASALGISLDEEKAADAKLNDVAATILHVRG